MRLTGSNLFLALLLSGGALADAQTGAPAGPTIGSITIEANNVFDTSKQPESKLFYRLANSVHVTTRESVIRRMLLFNVGDPYNLALLQETERNLRALSFIRRALVVGVVNSSGTVDVLVRTHDAWTLEVVASFKRAGGQDNLKAGLADHNLMGTGKNISAVYERFGASIDKSFVWRDQQFLGTRLDQQIVIYEAPESRKIALSLKRPFYASIVPSSLGGSVDYAEKNVPNFSGETQIGTVRKRDFNAGVSYGVAFGTSTHRSRHITVGILHSLALYNSLPTTPSPAPPKERLTFLQLGGNWQEFKYIKERHIQKYSREEDFNLGFGVFPSVSWSPKLRMLSTTESQILPKISLRKGLRLPLGPLVLLRADYSSTYVNGGNGHRIATIDFQFFSHVMPKQTLAMHAAYDHGWRLDPASPLTLGEAGGLRGYGLTQFSGNRRVLFNVEDRIFIRDEVWSLVDIGAVLFFDSGYVWGPHVRADAADLKSSVGAGLRLAPSRSSSNDPVRIDLAYALNGNQTKTPWSLSILAGHAFGP